MSQKLIKRHNSLALKVAVAELAAKKKHRHTGTDPTTTVAIANKICVKVLKC